MRCASSSAGGRRRRTASAIPSGGSASAVGATPLCGSARLPPRRVPLRPAPRRARPAPAVRPPRVAALRGCGLGGCFLRGRGLRGCGLVAVGLLGRSLALAGRGLDGRHHHDHVAALLVGALLDRAELGELVRDLAQQYLAALGVRHLAPAEHDRDLHLLPLLEEPQDVALLGLVVVRRDLRPQLHLADRHLLLVLARRLLLLLLLVLVLRVVEHAADGRARLGGDLDEVEVPLARILERLVGLHDADLLALLVDQAYLGDTNTLVDACRVPLRRAPIEPARDRH